jgi:hypothetical protein
MKTIRNWNDLEPYGIDALTGEACAYSYRLLCDVTAAGARLIQDCFGVPGDPWPLNAPWNSRGSASIMLPHSMFQPLAVFALIKAGCPLILVMEDGVYGQEEGDNPNDVNFFIQTGKLIRQVRNPGFSRHTHAMSGRTV